MDPRTAARHSFRRTVDAARTAAQRITGRASTDRDDAPPSVTYLLDIDRDDLAERIRTLSDQWPDILAHDCPDCDARHREDPDACPRCHPEQRTDAQLWTDHYGIPDQPRDIRTCQPCGYQHSGDCLTTHPTP